MSTLPLFAAIPAMDPTEKATLSLSFDYKTTPQEDGGNPLVNLLSKVFIDGKQIGLVSSLEIKVKSDEVFPQIVIRLGEGFSKEVAHGCSDDLRAAARRYIAELRRFPFVTIESPFLEEPECSSET